jgi:hypothetical protein
MQLSINHDPNDSDKIPDDISEQLEQLCIKPLTEIEQLELKEWENLLERKKNDIK